MSTLSITLPNSIRQKIEELAKAEGITVDQFMATAAAEKLAAMMSLNFLSDEAAKADRAEFERVLRSVPDVEPEPHDRLPE